MQTSIVILSLAAAALASPSPQVTGDITPTASAPAGCSAGYSGEFQITALSTTVAKRDLVQRQSACGSSGTLTISLANGQLTDSQGRIGYIASNYQFQFDAPPQNGAIYTGGFSACSNGSLALGGSAVFYECLSGGFYNLYDRSWASQCSAILIEILPCGSSSPAIGQTVDGQPQATTVVTQIADGQPQAASAIPISEYSDGQPQVPTKIPVAQITDGQIQATGVAATATASPVTQISDGQVQAPGTAAVKTSPTMTPIAQISDGQIQASGAASATSNATYASITLGAAKSSSTVLTGAASLFTFSGQLVAAVVGVAAVALL